MKNKFESIEESKGRSEERFKKKKTSSRATGPTISGGGVGPLPTATCTVKTNPSTPFQEPRRD